MYRSHRLTFTDTQELRLEIRPGRFETLGAVPDRDGVNFAVFSAHAERIELCLFDAAGGELRLALPERTGAIWHGFVPGLGPGAQYGFRAFGPYRPEEGLRFNHHKLLLDPYAREFTGGFREHPSWFAHLPGAPETDLSFNEADSAPHLPRCVVTDPGAPSAAAPRPGREWGDTVIYEAHVKGLTMAWPGLPDAVRGTYDALGHPSIIAHLRAIGVTAVELLPIQSFVDEAFLTRKNLSNYWGYNPIGYFALDQRYLGPAGRAGFRDAVRRLHDAGIEVILDVVYNHTGEGDHLGPTLSFRGLDNTSYYRLRPDEPRFNIDDTGCGNTLDTSHPAVIRLILDSLRHWALDAEVDGFRFDLATTLAREEHGFDAGGGFLDALLQDPVLASRKLIAEPWDIGPGGYQLGNFPPPFAEWNDRFRDDARRFWRGDEGAPAAFATRLLGSADHFDRQGRRSWSSVNFITAHDGFTLADLVSYANRHNAANGERNRDGHHDNLSDSLGVEGPTEDPVIGERRARRRRNLLLTLFVSQGTPMLLAGDEAGNSQAGNNNAYCQDNLTGWVDWSGKDSGMPDFVARLAALRRAHPALRQTGFLHGEAIPADGLANITWLALGGGRLDWGAPDLAGFCIRLRAQEHEGAPVDDVLLAFNAGPDAVSLVLPKPTGGGSWIRLLDTARPAAAAHPAQDTGEVEAESAAIFHLRGDRPRRPAMTVDSLNRLAVDAGILPSFHDLTGVEHHAPPETKASLLEAMGLDVSEPEETLRWLTSQRESRPLPPALVVEAETPTTLPVNAGDTAWHLAPDPRTGQKPRGGRTEDGSVALPALPVGLHIMTIAGRESLIVAAPAHAPDLATLGLAAPRWGVTLALYGLSSRHGNGLGSYRDLGTAAEALAAQGADFVGINPVHALGWAADTISPYSPTHRGFLNTDHIAGTGTGMGERPALSPQPPGAWIDYPAFRADHRRELADAFSRLDAASERELSDFCRLSGPALVDYSVFEALSERYGADWRLWPEALSGPTRPEVRAFAAENGERIRFHSYLQWRADRELADVQSRAKAAGMALGLYGDLAIGVRPDGAELWSEPAAFARGVSLGTPPDQFSATGQVWNLAPMSPRGLEERLYRPFVDTMRTAVRHAGLLRIDHVLGLMRCFWVPIATDGTPTGLPGAYLRYPWKILLAIAKVEAVHAGCILVGEDLGVLPEGLRHELAAAHLYGCAVSQFERREDGTLRHPAEYRRETLASFGTHDTPTLRGFWRGWDIDRQHEAGLIDQDQAAEQHRTREKDRHDLYVMLDEDGSPPDDLDQRRIAAMHNLLGTASSELVAVQLDDVLGTLEQANVPGTVDEYPNWRRRYPKTVEELGDLAGLAPLRQTIRSRRGEDL